MSAAPNPGATTLLSLRLLPRSTTETVSGRVPSFEVIETLTQRMTAGDEKAFAAFHAEYFDRLYQFLIVVCHGQEDEAQEALQQTLLRVVRYVRPFKCEETFWCWLKAVARSAARDVGRKQRRYRSLLTRFSLWRQPTPFHSSEDSLRAALEESLAELAPDERDCLIKKYIDGLAVRELCSQTGLTEKAIESRLLRLRRRLRKILLKKLNSP
jgi:RNA polymerase sigma factor (sigma-70 family)